jgi:predicted metallopeptidase
MVDLFVCAFTHHGPSGDHHYLSYIQLRRQAFVRSFSKLSEIIAVAWAIPWAMLALIIWPRVMAPTA